jgi:hypothetical protein
MKSAWRLESRAPALDHDPPALPDATAFIGMYPALFWLDIMAGGGIMKFLLTSAGISNASIHNALVELLGKPISESRALFIPTAIYSLPTGADIAYQVIRGSLGDPFCEMGWKSLGVLELTSLPSIKKERWLLLLQETDALLVGGGDCQYLATGCSSPDWQICCRRCYGGPSTWG